MQNNCDLKKSANQKAESSLEFISTVSHDFRTPLTVIKLYADFMIKDLEQIDLATHHKYLSVIKAGADDLNFLLANARDFQKISFSKMDWNDEEHDIAKLLAKAVYPFEIACQTQEISFSFDSDIENLIAIIDAERLSLLVYNLLENALKFTEHGGINIRLSLSDATDAKNVHLTIRHNDRGIPEELLNIIMAPNTNSNDAYLSKIAGTGLYVAKHIIDHYQGRIWAENILAEGSVVHVELPLQLTKLDE